MAVTEFEKQPMAADMLWPRDRRVAVVFNLAWEMWSPGATSGVGPMGNLLADGIFDPNADSFGRYNATHGIPRLVSILERRGVPATLMTSALVAEAFPEQLRAHAARGHDIVGHGVAQDMIFPTLPDDAAERAIARSTAAIEVATGSRPSGCDQSPGDVVGRRAAALRAPRLRLARRCARRGHAVSPAFRRRRDPRDPMAVEFNDLPHAMRFGRTPQQFVEMFRDALAGLKSQPAETLILDVFAHGHCYGRPAGAWAIDEIARLCTQDADLWLTTRSEIAAHCRRAGRQAA